MAQRVTVEVDWTSKSGAADATIAFGETFNVSITGMSNVTGHLRLVLLSQSVSSDEAVLWSKEYPVSTQEEGPVEIESVRIFTPNVYDALKAQGGKAKLYLSVLNVRGEETVTDDDGETNQVAITTDYGVARITLTLGSYLDNAPIPEDFDPDTMTIGELQDFLTQVKFDTQFYRNEAEQFKNSALVYSNMASNSSSSAASSAGRASTSATNAATAATEAAASATNAAASATEAASSAESAQSSLTEATEIAATVASQADACTTAKEEVLANTAEVRQKAEQVASDAAAAEAAQAAAEAAKSETEQLLDTKQDKLVGVTTNLGGNANNAIRLINRAGAAETTQPVFRFGSQMSGSDIATDKWFSDFFYNAIEFTAKQGVKTRLEFERGRDDSIVRKEEMDTALTEKQDKLIAGANITIAADGKTISATGGGVVECDDTLSDESTNPIQNQWLGKRMGATETNSVQIGYDAKAGKTNGEKIDGSGGDDGFQVAVGRRANGSVSGAAVGYDAIGGNYGAAVGCRAAGGNRGAAVGHNARGSTYGAAVGYDAQGSTYGAAVGNSAKTNSVQGAVAIGNQASANSTTPIVIGGSQLASTAQITVSSDGTLKVGGKEIGGGGGNTEVWNGTIDSIDGVTDDMIGAKKLSNGNYPRLHARNKEIHGCKGFSNETGDYTGQELLLPWDVAMTNESSYLMAGVKFQANRGFGTQTFVQPLVPKETGSAQAYGFTYALPAFEDSPVYWKGHFIYSNARQIHLPWDKITTGGQGTLALTSDIPDTSGFLVNSGSEGMPKLSGAYGVEINSAGANGVGIFTSNGGKINGFVLSSLGLTCYINGVPRLGGPLPLQTVYDSLKYGATANNGCCFTPVANADNSLAFTIDRTKTLYAANITADALETTLSVSDSLNKIADGEVCVIWLHIKVASTVTTAPQIAVPTTIQFLDNGPSFAVGSECMLALMSTDGGATWKANVQWEKAVSA